MLDPLSGVVAGMLAQIVGDLATDLIEDLAHPRGARVVDRPIRIDRRRPDRLRPRLLGPAELDRLVAGLAPRLAGVRRAAGDELPDHEWAAALATVRDCLARSAPLGVDLVLCEARLDPRRLERHLRATADDLPAAAGLSDRAEAAYDAMLRLASAHIVEFVTSRPEFTVWVGRHTVQQSGEILDRVIRLQEDLTTGARRVPGDAESDRRDVRDLTFARRYAEYMVSRLDTLELVGVTLRRTPRRYALDLAYTNLSVAHATAPDGLPHDGRTSLTGAGVAVTEALAGTPRVVVRGTAGSGKSTTLQWLAVRAGRMLVEAAMTGHLSGDPTQWPVEATVPLVVPLRRFVTRGLPGPDQLLAELAKPLAHAAPPGWLDRVLAAGRAMVLVDGVDEVPSRPLDGVGGVPGQQLTVRSDVDTWLDDFVAAYPAARFVVTSRLSAVPEGWLSHLGFQTFDLLPMAADGIRDLIERWHDAVAADLPTPQAAQLGRFRSTLPAVVASRPELHRLANTPLLCALICALNWDRQMELPTDRAGLYEAALDMLLDRRDTQRGVTAPEGIELTAREQWALLQQLAYHLVKNGTSELGVEAARAQLARPLARTRSRDVAPAAILRHLVTRTGLLREDPVSGDVRFAHRTFQDYLGAREALEEGDVGLLVGRGHDDRWLDVIVMAAAQARPRECGTILAGLLDRGDNESDLRERLHLVAAAAAAQSVVVDPAGVRDRVERATAALIPPTSDERARALARAGEFVVDLLPGPEGLDDVAAAYVVRTAALIGTDAARDLILRFIPGRPSPRIVDELLRAWRATPSPDEYARTVLSPVRFGDVAVAVHRHRLPYLRHLPHLHSVRCLGDLVDLEVFGSAPGLRRLELFQNDALRDRHLSALTGCANLQDLVLVRCGSVRDLTGLAAVGLTDLTLTFTDRVDVDSLRLLESLRSLNIRLPRLRHLRDLPANLRLRRLAFGSRLPEASLDGVERSVTLEELEIVGTPSADDVKRLSALERLGRITASAGTPEAWTPTLRQLRPDILIVIPDSEGSTHVA